MSIPQLAELLENDLVSAARRKLIDAFKLSDSRREYLLTLPENDPDRVQAEFPIPKFLGPGGLIGQDGVDGHRSGPHSEAWVFPGLDNEGRPLRPVEGSNKCSIAILQRDHWNSNPHNTMNMPVLRILIYADTVRDAAGNPQGRLADLRVRKVAKMVDATFHDPANRDHLWNAGKSEELYVIASLRSPGGGLNIMDIPDNDFAARGDLRYEISVRDWA